MKLKLIEPDDNMAIQEHPNYHEGFFDAIDFEPLFKGECSKEYEAGWRAWWEVHEIINAPDFLERSEAARLPRDPTPNRFNN